MRNRRWHSLTISERAAGGKIVKRGIGLIILFGVFMLAACGPPVPVVPTPTVTPTPIVAKPTFCPKVEITQLDFGVLDDVRILLQRESVFRDTVREPKVLMQSTLDTFFAVLGVSENNIPKWAQDAVNDELALNPGRPDFTVFNAIYERLSKEPAYSSLDTPKRKKEMLENSIRGMIKALKDPFAAYMTVESWQMGMYSTTGRYRGIGVGLETNKFGEIAISRIEPGTPADEAGLRAGDAILAVDKLTTDGCNVSDFILRIRVRSDPTMALTIARQLQNSLSRETLDFQIVMRAIEQRAVSTYPPVELPSGRGSTAKDVPYRCPGDVDLGEPCPFLDQDGYGYSDTLYIKIAEFSEQASQDLEYVLQKIDTKRFSGIVIDLRGNPGGLVDAIINSVDYFLPNSDVIYKDKNARGVITGYRMNRVTYVPANTPIAILVDANSYSGAELFPAALRDNGRAVIVSRDKRTGGKGTVNRYFPLRLGTYGGVYVSILLWLSPSGDIIENQDLDNDGVYEIGGLRPDIKVEWSNEDYIKNGQDVNYDPTLKAALEYLSQHAPQ